jgi:hypothetical protein
MSSFGVYIGYDESEHDAAMVAAKSLREVTNGEIEPEFLWVDKLAAQGLYWRPVDHRGQNYDLISSAPASTDFAASRFLTPILRQSGFQLFCDCDVVFLEDPREMLHEAVTGSPVYVVKHEHAPVEQTKMVNKVQTAYPRKNWSSVMLFDCDHIANRRLSLRDVNERTGRDLHSFYWLNDGEIGRLNPRWNWLVNVQPEPKRRGGIAHFTLGGPFNPGWKSAPHDELWYQAASEV